MKHPPSNTTLADQHDPITGLVIQMAGTPRAQPRGRHVGGRVVSTASPKARAYRLALGEAARRAVENLGGREALAAAWGAGSVRVDIVCEFPTPKTERHDRAHTHKPDGDNLAKLVADVLVRAGALGGDDSRVADWSIRKVWAARGRLLVTVKPVAFKGLAVAFPDAAPGWLDGGKVRAQSSRLSKPLKGNTMNSAGKKGGSKKGKGDRC